MGLVRLYAALRSRADDDVTVELRWSAGDTIAEVLRELLSRKPGLDGYILDDDGQIRPHVSVFLDGRDIRDLEGLESRVDGDTEIAIFPPVAGG